MRVLFVADACSRHTQRWVNYFVEHGNEVHVASFRFGKIPGACIHVLPTYGLGKIGYFLSIFKLRKFIKEIKPNVVNAHYVTSYGFIAALASTKPLVLTAWGTDVLITPTKSFILRQMTRYALGKADAVTTVASHMVGSIESLGALKSKIYTIPFGVDINVFRPNNSKYEQRNIKLICTRNHEPIYDVVTLIKAVGILKESQKNVSLVLVGSGSLTSDLVKQSKHLGISSNILFAGHKDHAEMSKLLADSVIFVTPALSDGNNVSLNEGMACGAFPIATDIQANSQWIEHGINGYLYQPGNAVELAKLIDKALVNVDLRKQAQHINFEIVKEKANWQNNAEKMHQLYLSLIS